jgi:hypothetical protein
MMRSVSLWLLLVTGIGCGDGINLGPADSQDLGAPPPISIGGSNFEDLPECSGATQLGCEDSQKCGIAEDEWACLSPGGQGQGEACTSRSEGDDCQAGLHCYQGSCHALCATSTPCSASDSLCVPIPSQADQLNICLSHCDPIGQDCPQTGAMVRQGCYLSIAGPVCAPVGKSPPSFPGQVCSYLNECAIGSGCVQIEDESRCQAYCDYQSNGDGLDPRCSIERLCRPLADSPTVGICR